MLCSSAHLTLMAVADRYMLFVVVKFQSCCTTKPNGLLGFKPKKLVSVADFTQKTVVLRTKKLGLVRAIETKTVLV